MKTLPDVDEVMRQVSAKKKYQHLDPDLVAFIASAEAKKRASLKEAVKATANKLHQVGWAYFEEQPPYANHLQELAGLTQDVHAMDSRDFCTKLMQEHASTRERLPILADFYSTLFQDIQPVHSILDLACGFNPLAVDWMPIEKTVTYSACDIFQDMADFLQRFFEHFQIPGNASVNNLLTHIPPEKAQVALLLKTLPCLEQAEKDSARRILTGIQAQYLIISFPVRSIGGKEKGMLAHYSSQFENLLADLGWNYTKFLFTSELVYRVERGK
jgi:16S rRNA (guanine(1405)-N(7))-methyltransferase